MSVVENLNKVLADTYALRLKTQNYHWNVEGERFKSLHELFEEQYDALAAAVDEIAEHIRQLGVKAPGSLSAFNELKSISDADDNLDANGMVHSLMESHEAVAKTVEAARAAAEDAGDEVVNDFMIGRLTEHRKAAWFLRSSLKQAA